MNIVPGDLLLDSSKIVPYLLPLNCYLPSKYDIQKQHASNSKPWGTAMNIIQINSDWHFGKSPLEVKKGAFLKHFTSAKVVRSKTTIIVQKVKHRRVWSQKNGSHIISSIIEGILISGSASHFEWDGCEAPDSVFGVTIT